MTPLSNRPRDLQVTADSPEGAVAKAADGGGTAVDGTGRADAKNWADAQVAGHNFRACYRRPSGAWRMPVRSSTCNVKSSPQPARRVGTIGPRRSTRLTGHVKATGPAFAQQEALVDTQGHRRFRSVDNQRETDDPL